MSAAELVGALAGIAELPRSHPKWQEWEKRGKELLTKDSAARACRSRSGSLVLVSLVHRYARSLRLAASDNLPLTAQTLKTIAKRNTGKSPQTYPLKKTPTGAVI
ncbi:conjugal transfer protein TraD (plasmid) [Escherichia coli]